MNSNDEFAFVPTAATAQRLRLRAAGFSPVPVKDKYPPIVGWPEMVGANEAQIIEWQTFLAYAESTGIITKHNPAADIDLKHPQAASAVEELAFKLLCNGDRAPVRFGNPPRRAILFRTDEPFKVIRLEFDQPRDPDDPEKKQAIEILGDGQQVVAFGIHPKTKRAYRWTGGEPGEVKSEDLPTITRRQAIDFLVAAEKLLVESFAFKDPKRSWDDSGDEAHADKRSSEPRASIKRVRAALNAIPNNDAHYNDWVRVGMATWHATDGSADGFVAWDAWSQKSTKYDAAFTSKTWAGFHKHPPHSLGAGTLFRFASEADPNWESGTHFGTDGRKESSSNAGDYFDDWRDGLPKLDLDADPVAVAKALAALIASRRDVLLNGHTPVRVVIEQGQDPRAVELTPEAVRAYAYDICRCIKTDKNKGSVETPLKQDIAKLYLHGLEGEWGLRPLRGISTSPLLAPDGSIRSASGYDEATGLWCHTIPAVSVPAHPTKDDAQKALLVLRHAFSTFPFGDAVMVDNVVDPGHLPQLDESTHLIALMTSTCRACLSLAPGFLYNAPSISGAGTGKGLLAKSACVVGSGVQPSAMTVGHSVEELDKRLVAAAIEARPAIYLDNFNEGMLDSHTLASFLTEDPARVRVLGHSKTMPLNTRAMVVITGNAVQIAEDMARRILQVMLDARMENPEQRSFAPGFFQSVFARRSELLSACLTIWRWGVQQGDALRRGRPIGSYEQWARWCRDPLLALGCRDPIERLADIKAADPRRRHLIEVFTLWDRHHSDQPVTTTDLHLAVKEAIDPDAKRNGDVVHYSRQRVAGFLRKHTDTRAGGFHLRAEVPAISAQRHSVARYRLLRGPASCAP